MSAEASGVFVWPPRPPAEPLESAASPVAGPPGLIDRLETLYLGRTGLSFEPAARRAGWAPDRADAYCGRCGGSIGPYESDGEGCPACRRKRLPWTRALRLGPYTGVLRTALLDLKFRGWRRSGREVGRRMGELLAECLERAQINPAGVLLVPIPSHWTRRLRFGVDHTLVLARAASGASGVPVRRLLARRRGPSQLLVPVSRRRENAARAFRGRKPPRTTPELVVLLDDVRTTGATLRSASRVVRSGCPVESLWVLTAGVTPARDRRERSPGGEGGCGSVSVVGGEEIGKWVTLD